MPILIDTPTPVTVPGGKSIDEYVGMVSSGTDAASVAHMRSPAGWSEPGQCPDFDEYTVVLKGMLCVEHRGGVIDVRPGQAIIVPRGEWVRYSTPKGAEYIAICVPAFTNARVHRDQHQDVPTGSAAR
jgi:quercetin dioxygenase-like cupin family protein